MATFFIEHHKFTAVPHPGAAMAMGMVFGGIGRLAGMPFGPPLLLSPVGDTEATLHGAQGYRPVVKAPQAGMHAGMGRRSLRMSAQG